jgi:transcription termination/antitermination protein NusA
LNARLAARLTGWRVDIQSETEFAQAEAEAAFAGGTGEEEFSGRCAAILANGKRCPNAALPGSRFCGVPAHQELAKIEAETGAYAEGTVQPVAPGEAEEAAAEATGEGEEASEEVQVAAISEQQEPDVEPEAPLEPRPPEPAAEAEGGGQVPAGMAPEAPVPAEAEERSPAA